MQVDLSMIAPEEFSTVLCNILQEQEAIGRLSDDFLMRGDRNCGSPRSAPPSTNISSVRTHC